MDHEVSVESVEGARSGARARSDLTDLRSAGRGVSLQAALAASCDFQSQPNPTAFRRWLFRINECLNQKRVEGKGRPPIKRRQRTAFPEGLV